MISTYLELENFINTIRNEPLLIQMSVESNLKITAMMQISDKRRLFQKILVNVSKHIILDCFSASVSCKARGNYPNVKHRREQYIIDSYHGGH